MTIQALESTINTEPLPITNDDIATLRELFKNLLDSWTRGDGDGYGDHFSEDADYIAFDGSHTKGRKAIAESHPQLFDTWLKGTRLIGEITNIRLLSDNVALLHTTGSTIMPKQTAAQARRPSIQTLIATKPNGEWHFTAFHNTRIKKWNPLQYALFGIATRLFRR